MANSVMHWNGQEEVFRPKCKLKARDLHFLTLMKRKKGKLDDEVEFHPGFSHTNCLVRQSKRLELSETLEGSKSIQKYPKV